MSCLGSFGILKPAGPARRDSVMELDAHLAAAADFRASACVNCRAPSDKRDGAGGNSRGDGRPMGSDGPAWAAGYAFNPTVRGRLQICATGETAFSDLDQRARAQGNRARPRAKGRRRFSSGPRPTGLISRSGRRRRYACNRSLGSA
jgi:hypothetical protein